jgi:hypothetical protein
VTATYHIVHAERHQLIRVLRIAVGGRDVHGGSNICRVVERVIAVDGQRRGLISRGIHSRSDVVV